MCTTPRHSCARGSVPFHRDNGALPGQQEQRSIRDNRIDCGVRHEFVEQVGGTHQARSVFLASQPQGAWSFFHRLDHILRDQPNMVTRVIDGTQIFGVYLFRFTSDAIIPREITCVTDPPSIVGTRQDYPQCLVLESIVVRSPAEPFASSRNWKV